MDVERAAERIAHWIGQKVQEAGAEIAVLGLSGGVDSAVVAALCRRALGGPAVLGVIMPCYSSPQDREDALRVAGPLGIETIEIPLEGAFDALMRVLPPGGRLAQANLKPRLRMLTWYYLANERNGLVVGSGNKVEIQVGYSTKYGDGGVDILPLGDLDKGQVRELALYLGVPQDIVHKPPSAGLWPGQTDEAEMGLSYDELDAAIAVLEGKPGAKVSPQVLDKVRRMQAASAHKRAMPPIFEIEP
ncbi:MAG: NAD+ synthase [Chloroflexia bacterium]|nr:NAD+ synthase [Chloroflexia bacterium]